MAQFIQLLYIFTIIIGAVCFSTQTMVVLKNLDVSNEMVKSKKNDYVLCHNIDIQHMRFFKRFSGWIRFHTEYRMDIDN